MVSDRRHDRMGEVLAQRLLHVRCAVEAVHHRHNLSAILRTCDSLGVHRVDLVEGPAFKPSRGAARGAERWLDLQQHAGAAQAIASIRADGYRVFVADLADGSFGPDDLPIDRPVCLWFGAEHAGVSEEAKAAADGVVTVPMRGFAQSLNVSVAAALALQTVATRARALGPEALMPPALQQATREGWLAREEAMALAILARQQARRLLP
jgi:tRNA (guanosine-2'-O-)-methyltransferase